MIEPKELRPGNWVLGRAKDNPSRFSNEQISVSDLDSRYKTFLPIPLAVHNMEVAGFKLLEKDWFEKEVDGTVIAININTGNVAIEDTEKPDTYVPLRPIKVKSLHQLQNLYYSLTGQELEVSL